MRYMRRYLNLFRMIKTINIVVLGAFLFTSASSCKKDYTCTCTLYTRQQNHQYSTSPVMFTYNSVTQNQAQKRCFNEANNYNSVNLANSMGNCGLQPE